MIEFGSDFHFIENYRSLRAHLTDVYRDAVLLADGRQCIVALIRQYGWKRLWMPEYFCYEVIATIAELTGVEIIHYADRPAADESKCVEALPFQKGDALLRMNYFGMRNLRSNKGIPVPVIEDHSHDLLGHWALYSNADWCIASLRKSLPLSEGGMLWSPKGHRLMVAISSTEENEGIAGTRWEAMRMKAGYLAGETTDKEAFRRKYIETEDWFDHAELSVIDEKSRKYIGQLDINAWYGAKRKNWQLLRQLVKTEAISPEDDSCTPFSFIFLAESEDARTRIRNRLIEHSVYPAILWNVPKTVGTEAQDFSQRMLSIHCDARYNDDDMRQLAAIINEAINL